MREAVMLMLTNKEGIEILKSKMDGSVDTSYEWCEAIRMAINALQNQTAWIPVGERLPDDFEHVLVTLGNGYDGVTYDWRSDGDWHDWGKSVIAWMPLPEPYKGAEDDADE